MRPCSRACRQRASPPEVSTYRQDASISLRELQKNTGFMPGNFQTLVRIIVPCCPIVFGVQTKASGTMLTHIREEYAMAITFTRLTDTFAAVVHGVDIATGVSDEDFATIAWQPKDLVMWEGSSHGLTY